MNTRLIIQAEIVSHQEALARDIRRSRATFTVVGLRQLIGNTLIALGMHLHGHDRRTVTPMSPIATA